MVRSLSTPLLDDWQEPISTGVSSRKSGWRERPAWLIVRLVRSPSALSSLVVALVAVGVGLGVHCEEWHPVAALYFVVQITTTVGYGDLTVTSELMKVFVAVYSLVILLIVAHVAMRFADQAASAQVDMLRARLRATEAHLTGKSQEQVTKTYGTMNKLVGSIMLMLAFVAFGTVFFRLYERCSCSYGSTRLKGCDDTTVESCERTGGSTKSWASSFYMSVITLTTVGFGDHTPQSLLGHAVACAWMLYGAGAAAFFLNTAAETLFQKELDLKGEIDSWETFRRADRAGDGVLTRAEYLEFVLVQHGLVEPDIIRQINREYTLLDTGRHGAVSYDMILAANMRQERARP